MKRKIISVFLTAMLAFGAFAVEASAVDDADLLACAVESAASGESYTVMASVASVLLNRLEADEYPATLAAVIADAGIDISSVTPSTRAYRAARDAIRGFDPTDGALLYTRDTAAPPFVRLKTGAWCFY